MVFAKMNSELNGDFKSNKAKYLFLLSEKMGITLGLI